MNTDLGTLGIDIQTNGFEQVMDNLDRLLDKSRAVQTRLRSLQSGVTGHKGQSYQGQSRAVRASLSALSGLGDDVGARLETVLGAAFDQFLVKGGKAKSLLKSLEVEALSLGSQYFTGRKSTNSGDLFSSLLGGAGNLLTNLLPGFAAGGQFMVGGAAGRDRNLVGLRLSRGERVTVQTPSQQKQAAASPTSAQTINLNFQISTPDVDSFRRSQSQIQSEALLGARHLLNRNG